jgi:hypothetical protein
MSLIKPLKKLLGIPGEAVLGDTVDPTFICIPKVQLGNLTMPSNSSLIVVEYYEIPVGQTCEIGIGATLQIE